MSVPEHLKNAQSRPKSFWERAIEGNGVSPLAMCVKFKNPEAADRSFKILTRAMPAFNLASDDEKFYSVRGPVVPLEIPENIQTTEEGMNWISEKFYTQENRLGLIAKRSDMIALLASHAVTDGTSIAFWAEHCLDDTLPDAPIFPYSMDEYFGELSKKSSHDFPEYIKCATLKYKNEPEEQKDKFLPWANTECPIEKLSCYDPELKRPHKLLENVWTALILAVSSYNGAFDRIGSVTSIDLRRFTENPNDTGFGLAVSGFSVNVKDITVKSTLEELGDSMRREYKRLCDDGVQFARLDFNSHFDPSDGPVSDIANLGSIKLDKDVEDVSVCVRVPYIPLNEFYNMSYTKVFEDKSIFFMRTSYVPSKLRPEEIKSIRNKIEYVLTSINHHTTTIEEALKQLEKI
ncbi:hypothetical protein TRFO_38911 [Tritrichomonas foetus]|uniref:Condensation domain-containing protein n=1 Tax=Tritrichomonas foetus TaxID=1144522 RepID=A0A1J4J6X4_9EUKA|nr:hypothetical protein TRFO_38911 [Tritrichomonas foetus]|eukprot:OHS94936.1 hypothetical protein TRFO_38911 [Tritrichomonas foetus]